MGVNYVYVVNNMIYNKPLKKKSEILTCKRLSFWPLLFWQYANMQIMTY
jgi:hypothetical protein